MILAVDIGNTNITLGLFDNNNLVKIFRLNSDLNISQIDYEHSLKQLLKNYRFKGCIIASVVENLDVIIKNIIDKIFQINSYILSSKSKLEINLKVDNPEIVGIDRIVNAVGAYKFYGKPAIVIDLGSATTFDVIDKNGDFIGGIIMTGLNMQLKALNSNTSKLPKIKIDKSINTIAKNTVDAMLSGAIRGSACAIEGLIKQCEHELGEKAIIIATGGFSNLISEYTQRKFNYVNPNLTLESLNYLYYINK